MELKDLSTAIDFNDKSFTKRILFDTDEMLCFVLNFKPGQSLPVHKHEQSAVVCNVLSGSGEIKINNEVYKIKTGSIAMAKGQDDFSVPVVNEAMSLFVTISPRPGNAAYAKELG